MNKESGVGEALKLLADFFADVTVVGMELLQLTFVKVDVLVGEFRFAQTADDVQDIQGPAAFFDG